MTASPRRWGDHWPGTAPVPIQPSGDFLALGLGHYFFFCGFRLNCTSPLWISICSFALAHSVPFVWNALPSLHLSNEHLLRLQYSAQMFPSPRNLPWTPRLVQDSFFGNTLYCMPCASYHHQSRKDTRLSLSISFIRLEPLQGRSQEPGNDLALP